MSKEPTDDFAGMEKIVSEVETWPKNKAPGTADDVLQIIVQAAQRAYHNKPGGYEIDEDGSLCGGMGDVATSLDGMMFSHDAMLCQVGAGIASGIARLIDDVDEDTANKIRRLVQVAVAGGYMTALLDDAAAGKRKSPLMTNALKSKRAAEGEEIRKFAAANPDMTQTAIGKALGCSRQRVGKYLNQ